MSIQNFNIYEGITSVNYVSSVNIVGSYNNGPLNNGINSFLTIPSNTFEVDSNQIQVGDSILLISQTNQNENGIYVCIQTDDIFSFSVIQRRPDFQSVEQLRAGQYISCGNGAVNSGFIFTLVQPLPNTIGIDAITFNTCSTSLNDVLTAGTAQGQAGDVFHCNAQQVIKVNINGTILYLPAFLTN